MKRCSFMGKWENAWFAANTQVTAQGMTVQATAENGLLISDATKGAWKSVADAVDAKAILFPTSTKDVTNWYHAVSTEADNAQAGQVSGSYTNLKNDLKLSDTNYGVGYIEKGTADSTENPTDKYNTGKDDAYYLLNQFYIKSSSADMSNINFYINDVTVSTKPTSPATGALDSSLRVAITLSGDKTNGAQNVYVYAPVSGATEKYFVGGKTDNESDKLTALTSTTGLNKETTITSVKATDSDAILASIYVYYEGEDESCKSTNITGKTADELSVTVTFGTTAISKA